MPGKLIARAKKSLGYLYYRYNLETHLYMCEPWERALVNTTFLIILSLLFLLSYWYLPQALGTIKSALPPLPIYLQMSSMKMQVDEL